MEVPMDRRVSSLRDVMLDSRADFSWSLFAVTVSRRWSDTTLPRCELVRSRCIPLKSRFIGYQGCMRTLVSFHSEHCHTRFDRSHGFHRSQSPVLWLTVKVQGSGITQNASGAVEPEAGRPFPAGSPPWVCKSAGKFPFVTNRCGRRALLQ